MISLCDGDGIHPTSPHLGKTVSGDSGETRQENEGGKKVDKSRQR